MRAPRILLEVNANYAAFYEKHRLVLEPHPGATKPIGLVETPCGLFYAYDLHHTLKLYPLPVETEGRTRLSPEEAARRLSTPNTGAPAPILFPVKGEWRASEDLHVDRAKALARGQEPLAVEIRGDRARLLFTLPSGRSHAAGFEFRDGETLPAYQYVDPPPLTAATIALWNRLSGIVE